MTITESKNNRKQVHLVGLERLRSEFDRIRSLKQDPFELKKGRGVHDDDSSTAMTEATMSITSHGSGEASMSSGSEGELPVDLQRLHRSRPAGDPHCDTASYVTPQASNKAKQKRSPSRSIPKNSDVDNRSSDVEENSAPLPSFFEELNDSLMSCFSCTSSYTPPTSSFLHYNNIPAPEPEGSKKLEEGDVFNPHSLRGIPFANRLG